MQSNFMAFITYKITYSYCVKTASVVLEDKVRDVWRVTEYKREYFLKMVFYNFKRYT